MCTSIILFRKDHEWPLIIGSNRDEQLNRKSKFPDRHWLKTYPKIIGGFDEKKQGTWLGINDDQLIAIDEIHTPDSSRFWVKNEYESRFNSGESQKMLDKENIRQWLINQGFSGNGTPPKLSDEIRISLAEHYIKLYNILLGKQFMPEISNVGKRVINNLKNYGYEI